MASYSFDVVSDFDRQELVNTLDQVRRDVGNLHLKVVRCAIY